MKKSDWASFIYNHLLFSLQVQAFLRQKVARGRVDNSNGTDNTS